MKNISPEPQIAKNQLEIILNYAKKSENGVFVEFGCYRGNTSLELAKILASQDAPESPSRLYLYDSFAGLPEKSLEDSSPAGDSFRAGSLLATKSDLIKRFKRENLPLPRVKKAFFETLSSADVPDNISFALLDGDLYSSIKTSLRLVAPKMIKNSVVIVHDYTNPVLPGVARAVDEYLKNHPHQMRVIQGLAILVF